MFLVAFIFLYMWWDRQAVADDKKQAAEKALGRKQHRDAEDPYNYNEDETNMMSLDSMREQPRTIIAGKDTKKKMTAKDLVSSGSEMTQSDNESSGKSKNNSRKVD